MTGSAGEVMAQHVYDALEEFNSLESIRAILVYKLGRNLRTVNCASHQNELPFRAISKKLDGVITGPQSFSEPLGKKM